MGMATEFPHTLKPSFPYSVATLYREARRYLNLRAPSCAIAAPVSEMGSLGQEYKPS